MFLYIVCSDFTDFIFYINLYICMSKFVLFFIVLQGPFVNQFINWKGYTCGNKTEINK